MLRQGLPALLLVLPLLAAIVPAQDAGAGWTQPDGNGDLRPLIDVGASYPSSPLGAHVDVTELAIRGEDELGFLLDITVRQLNVAPNANLCCLAQGYYYATFKLSTSPIEYNLNVFVGGSDTNANTGSTFSAFSASGQLCLYHPDDGYCYYQPVYPTLDDEADTIHVYIPKASLLGLLEPPGFFFTEGRPPGLAATIRPGDQLMDLYLNTNYTPGLLLLAANMQDDVPDVGTAPPYRFERGMANGIIGIQVGGADAQGSVAVQAGENQTIPFTIQNKAAGKRLVQLEYEVAGTDEAKRLFQVYGPASVTVPGGQTRNFSFAVNVGGASQTDAVVLRVRGTSVGHPDEVGLGAVRLVPSATLSDTSNKLFLHATRYDFLDPALQPVYCNSFLFGSCTVPFLSPTEQHPLATEGARFDSGGFYFGGTPQDVFFVDTELATAAPIMFDATAPISVDVSLAAPAPTPATVRATIAYSSPDANDVIFEAQAPATLSSGPTVVTLTGPARFNPEVRPVLPAGTWITMRVEVIYDVASAGTAAWAAGGSQLVAGETRITFPLVPLPEDLRREAVPSPLQLTAVDEPEDFVNPGEGRLYNLSVLNQAEETIRFRLDAASGPGWGHLVLPGDRFEVAAGDIVTFAVLVTADANLTEGDVGLTWINATTIGYGGPDANVSSVGGALRTIVTEFDLPDDSAAFVADPEDASKLVAEEGKNTPGFAAVAVAAALALALAVHSRRRLRK